MRKIIPLHFLHIGGKDCIYVATLKRWLVADSSWQASVQDPKQ
jgi:hypothetical protein